MEVFEALLGILGYWRILLPIAIAGLGAHSFGLFQSNGILAVSYTHLTLPTIYSV